MREYGSNIILPSLDNLFSSEQERQDAKLEKIQILPLSELYPFEGHPFQVRDDEEMDKMVDSVKEYGVMTPAIVRPRRDGGYEIVAGHRRCHASQRAGVDTMPCIVRDMDDDTAIILMVDSNCQREHILPSEKAKAYQMKLEAIKRKCGRPSKINSGQLGQNFSQPYSVEKVADEAGESVKQVQRFIRLNKLTPDLMQLVDNGRLKTTPAVELSYLTPEEQEEFLSYMEEEGCTPSLTACVWMMVPCSRCWQDTAQSALAILLQQPSKCGMGMHEFPRRIEDGRILCERSKTSMRMGTTRRRITPIYNLMPG